MKIESNLLNISMPQSDRVQEPSKAQSQASSSHASRSNVAGDGVDLGSQAGLVASAQAAGLGRSGEHHRRVCGRWFNPVSIKWIALH